ncbi:hypothetical protein [Burkholderia sp. F1]|uniref:hypothetical protein n=1 Tax=Burkholderia sp. F1 TaxID=3366817 RepID=UPI003D73E8A9
MFETTKAGCRRPSRGIFQITQEGKAVRHLGKIFALLIDFATLSEKSRKEFLTMMNEYLLMSPAQRRRAINEWKMRQEGCQHDAPGESIRR